jgi:hypothetical protein
MNVARSSLKIRIWFWLSLESYCCQNRVVVLFSILVSSLSINDQFTLNAKMSFIEKSCITICNNRSE